MENLLLYRIISGTGKNVRKLIDSLEGYKNNENLIILPEQALDINEQSAFLKNLNNSFVGDIITLSPFIISDAPDGSVLLVDDNGNYIESEEHKFGLSFEMTSLQVLNKETSVSDIALQELKILKDKVTNGTYTKKNILKELSKFGDSFEKTNVINVLRAKESENTINSN